MKKSKCSSPGQYKTQNYKNTYILASVYRYSRYPLEKVYHNCDTALSYIEEYIKFHGIPRNIKIGSAHAILSKKYEIFSNDSNIKLRLATSGMHRIKCTTRRQHRQEKEDYQY